MRHALLLIVLGSLLPGCAVTQDQNTPVQYTLERNPASGRAFYLYVPSNYKHDRPAPLIVTCHGTPPFDTAERHIMEMKMLGERNGCIVVAPTLVGTDGVLGDGPVSAMVANERYILSTISSLMYRYNIDRANIMITGFSGGGFPAYWVGLRNPDVFSVVAARNCNFSRHNIDGWFPAAALRTPVMVYYGSNDPAAIKLQSESAVRYLRGKGFAVETAVIPGAGHERHPEVAMQFFRKNWRPPRPSLIASAAPSARAGG